MSCSYGKLGIPRVLSTYTFMFHLPRPACSARDVVFSSVFMSDSADFPILTPPHLRRQVLCISWPLPVSPGPFPVSMLHITCRLLPRCVSLAVCFFFFYTCHIFFILLWHFFCICSQLYYQFISFF